jgi:pantoate--beta-alanine ligase
LTRSQDVVRTRADLERAIEELRAGGGTLALVPTMGNLHAGHLSLIHRAQSLGDRVALSIFVNPLQFGAGEDLARYPRTEADDLLASATVGVDLAFVPAEVEMYPDGPPSVRIDPGPLAERLCGLHRPGHFQGVLTVVARLFGLFRPEVAVFGRKDFQQAVLIRRMVRDLELGVRVEVAPLVREADGLALSSRNRYLNSEERREAPRLFQALAAADQAFRMGERRPAEVAAVVRGALALDDTFRTEYVEVVDAETLDPVSEARAGHIVAAVAWLGSTRLIDNLVLGASVPDPTA